MSCSSPQVPPAPLRAVRGSSKTWRFTIRDATNSTVDLTGAKVWFTVKNRLEDISAVFVKRNVAAGGVDGQALISTPQTGATKGQFQVFLTPPDTAGLDPYAPYWCDAWVELSSGKRYQVMSNRQFVVDPTVTTSFI